MKTLPGVGREEGKVNPAKRDRLIESIYDAAVDSRRWDDAMVVLADALGCAQTSLEFYDRGSGCLKAYNPYCAPNYVKSYIEDWLPQFPHWRMTQSWLWTAGPRSDVMDGVRVLEMPCYNVWLKPQGIGGDSRFANLAANSRAYARLLGLKPLKARQFSRDEDELLQAVTSHFIRSLAIHRRLRMAEAGQRVLQDGAAPEGFLIADAKGTILGVDPATQRRLIAGGLVAARGPQGRLRMDNPALQRLIAAASRPSGEARCGGQVEHRGADGALLRNHGHSAGPGSGSDHRSVVCNRPSGRAPPCQHAGRRDSGTRSTTGRGSWPDAGERQRWRSKPRKETAARPSRRASEFGSRPFEAISAPSSTSSTSTGRRS